MIHIAVPEFYYIPAGMEYNDIMIMPEIQMASIEYQYNGAVCLFSFGCE